MSERNHLYEDNKDHPLLDYENYFEDSKGIRINANGKNEISSAFLITLLLSYFDKKTMDSTQKGDVFIVAGEVNFESYSRLKDYYLDLIGGSALNNINKIIFIGGPNISYSDDFELTEESLTDANYILKLSFIYPEKINLYLKTDLLKGREKYHFIVHEKSDDICLIEDYHKEFNEKSSTIIFNNPLLCNFLRDKVKKVINSSEAILITNEKRKFLMERMKTKSDIVHL